MGLKKTSRTKRRPTRAAGCYGCWLSAPRRAAGRGAHGRLRQGNGAGTGAGRSGLLDHLRGERTGRRPGPDRQRAKRVRRWRRRPYVAPQGGFGMPHAGRESLLARLVLANRQRYTTFCRPDTLHGRWASGEGTRVFSFYKISRSRIADSAICLNTGAADVLPVNAGCGLSNTTMTPISGRSAGSIPMNETIFSFAK